MGLDITLHPISQNEQFKNLIAESDAYDPQNKESYKYAIQYALENGTGLFEATEIVIPLSNECYSDYNNFRAPFLKNVSNLENAREK